MTLIQVQNITFLEILLISGKYLGISPSVVRSLIQGENITFLEILLISGKYLGISPPVVRSQDDFDPGAKYHIPGLISGKY